MDIDMTGNELEGHSAATSTPRSTELAQAIPKPLHALMPNATLSTPSTRTTKPAELGRYCNREVDKSSEAVEPRVEDEDNAKPDSTSTIKGLGSWTAKLADLNVRMSQRLQSFPKAIPGDKNTGQFLPAKQGDGMLAIDRTLHLSQEFVDFIGHTLKMIPPAPRPWQRPAIEASGEPPNSVSLNAASELLMLSTHLNHLQIDDGVFRHIQACLSQARKDSNASFPFTVPSLTIGSFSMSSRPETQLLFSLSLMDSMLVRCRDLIGQIAAPMTHAGTEGVLSASGE